MRKDAPLAFRIPAPLKTSLEQIARDEARSLSQVCEKLLTIGAQAYRTQGPQYLQSFLCQRVPKATGRPKQ